jgi:hypothetical protein
MCFLDIIKAVAILMHEVIILIGKVRVFYEIPPSPNFGPGLPVRKDDFEAFTGCGIAPNHLVIPNYRLTTGCTNY